LLPLHVVVAVGRGGCIGKGGSLPWRVPEDLKRFKALTMGHAIIMGRKTFDSIGRALPGRRSLVVTRGTPALPEGVERCGSVGEAIARARETDPEPMVIGGGEIYREALPVTTHVHLTRVDVAVDGCDAFFPELDQTTFRLVSTEPAETAGVVFLRYERVTEI
jgi:dihydrofolate reductase